MPNLELGIVDDGVFQLVAADGVGQVEGVFLIGELGRMDAYDRQFLGVFLFQFPQLRKYVGAVDSTIGPEVQNNYPSPQVV